MARSSELEGAPRDHLPLPEFASVGVAAVSCVERRLDAAMYLSEGFQLRHRIESSGLDVSSVADIASVWQPARLKGVTVSPGQGTPYLLATQVFDIWPTPRKWLAESKIPDADRLFVANGWILVTRSGTVGLPIITYDAHKGNLVSDDLLRVEVSEPRVLGYLYAFLRTRFGRSMMRASHYGNVIKHLEVSHLEAVPVPIIDNLVDEVSDEIAQVFSWRSAAYGLDQEAQEMLTQAIGLPDLPGRNKEEAEVGFSVRAEDVFVKSRRLDAQANSPNVSRIRNFFGKRGYSADRLEDLAEIVLPGRFGRIYGDHGPLFYGSEDLFRLNPEVTKRIAEATKIDKDEYRVEPGWLLMARSGQIYGLNGSVLVATEWHSDKLVSEHVLRIIPRTAKVGIGYLQAVLAHPRIGQPIVLSKAYGTSIPELDPDEIGSLPIVRLRAEDEEEIAGRVQEAAVLRMRANEKEDGAVARLERAIEDSLEEDESAFDRFEELTAKLVNVPHSEVAEKRKEKRAKK